MQQEHGSGLKKNSANEIQGAASWSERAAARIKPASARGARPFLQPENQCSGIIPFTSFLSCLNELTRSAYR